MNLTFEEKDHIYRIDGIIKPSVTQILSSEGFYPDFSKINDLVMERANNYGTAVHKACELNDLGKLNTRSLDKSLIQPLNHWNKFLSDYDLFPNRVWIERQGYCKKYDYCFTLDRILYNGSNDYLIDIKTGSEISRANGLQLAGYDIGFTECTGMKIDHHWIVKLTEEKYEVIPFDKYIKEDRRTFLSAVNTYNWKARYLKNGTKN